MRSAEEMVQELDREASNFSVVAIVVAFDDTSRFVFHDDDSTKTLTELRSMIEAGGEPFGLLGYVATETKSSVGAHVYDEFLNTVWAKPLMDELAKNMAATLQNYQERGGSA
jgi:hypothetical protein